MSEDTIQPSFFQWRKKVNAALAIDASRVKLVHTDVGGRQTWIDSEELQSPKPGTYTARYTGPDGAPQEISSDFEVASERPIRRPPEDMFLSRYERMADDLEHARLAAEARARAAEAEKLAALETVAAQYRRIQELEHRIHELEQKADGLFDDDTALLILEAIDHWSGATELKGQVRELLTAIEDDPRAAERIVRRVPQVIASLAHALHEDDKE